MENRHVGEYLGLNVITNASIPHRQFIYFNIHNSLIDSSMGTPIQSLGEMIKRASDTGSEKLIALNNVGRTIYAVPMININPVIFQEILALTRGLKAMAEASGKTLKDIFDVRGLELHRVHFECTPETIINGEVLFEDETIKIVDVKNYTMEELLELDASKLSFGLFAKTGEQ